MVTILQQRDIAAPAARVWSSLREFGAIHRVHPEVVHSRHTGGPEIGVGAERRCELDTAGRSYVLERQIAFDDERRTQEVEIIGGSAAPPMRSTVTIAVEETGPESSSITMEAEFSGNLLQRLLAATAIRARFTPVLGRILQGVEVHALTGRDVTGRESLAVLDDA